MGGPWLDQPSASTSPPSTSTSPPSTSTSPPAVSSLHPCCSRCPHHWFCSPQSYSCYHSQWKSYYEDCGPWVDQPTSPRRRSASTPSPSAWRPSGWCPSFDNRGWRPDDCRKSYICTVGGVTHFCSSGCAVCQT